MEANLAVKIAFTGLSEQAARLRSQIDKNIAAVLDHQQFIMGPEVRILEEKLQKFCGAKHAIAVANGTDALQIALMAQGISPGDSIFVPSFTYTATAEVILILGAVPIFVDVKEGSFNIDCDDLKLKIAAARQRGANPKAVIAVDLFGLPADWKTLNAIARAEGLALIADAAQSYGAVAASGQKVGTLAPITTTSFFPAKPLGCYGDGGAIFTDDDDLAQAMRSIRVHGQGKAKYETVRVGMNSRLDTIQAAILLAKLEIFAEEIENRNALAHAYHKRLSAAVRTPEKPDGVISAWAQYTVRVHKREQIQTQLSADGVPTAVYYPLPMHLQPAYAQYGNGPGSLTVSERLSSEVMSLPMNPYWQPDDVETVCLSLLNALSN
ncbi:MAG: DegT/DnrJ/EryC1/StrS family aminotransferase [Sphingomonadales bacterium]|nr:DegT/DnrJ/EryC1/StrS family aminotransferase [Sphingomonadales bacterium]MBK9004881.1 DegT/DnrJ/EryC1/StrS family aminotransferase [Sphingomonadales bacterium]MBK9267389.1 DegT/DnrJ/EryC1/StrS family aminotransferase [Sphingomonadales bacterium]